MCDKFPELPVALILAINPGNSHSPTLARLARELRGCELIGAESCKVAITAINQRVPDVVLLPDRSPRGEADLLARLRAVPGGVPTLQLPPVATADPAVLAKEIRKLLAGQAVAPASPAKPVAAARPIALASVAAPKLVPAPKPAGASPRVIAAAKATVTWIRLQRAQWPELDALDVAIESGSAFALDSDRDGETGSAFASAPALDSDRDGETGFASDPQTDRPSEVSSYQAYVPEQSRETAPAPDTDRFGEAGASELHEPARVNWLARVAGLAGVAVLVVGGVWFWQISSNPTNTTEPFSASSEPAPADTGVPAPVAEPQPPTGTAPETAEKNSGWIAVSAPFTVTVTSANESILLDDRGRGMLAPGQYRLRFQNAELGYDEARVIEVRPTATTTINLAPQTRISVTSTEPGAVLIDGKNVGQTPFAGRVEIGSHTVTVRAAGGERQFTIDATMQPVQLDVDFSKPQP